MIDIRKEIEFWTLILRDHAYFQFTSLSPKEVEAIQTADYFLKLFNQLNQEVTLIDRQLTSVLINDIIENNKQAVEQFIEFKKSMLCKLLTCNIDLAMSPTFLNHMINEAMEYLKVLSMVEEVTDFDKVLEMLRLHTIWLPDASGHANYIASQLDGIETYYAKIASDFQERFDMLFKKANELFSMYKRVELKNGVLTQFNEEVEGAMDAFINYLVMLKKLRKECKITATGTFSEMVLDHMKREEDYYLYHIKSLMS